MPSLDGHSGALAVTTPFLLDATADRVAAVFAAPKSGAIRKLGFLLGAVTIGGTSTLIYSLQTVDATTGFPDDTDDETATILNAAIVANTMVVSGNLSADRTVTVGERIAAVVKFGTFNASDTVEILASLQGTRAGINGTEYVASNSTGSYAKSLTTMPLLEIIYSDGSYAFCPALAPWETFGTDTYNNGSTPDEIGLRFTVPAPMRLAGCWFNGDSDGDANFNLYDSGGKTTLLSGLDKDIRQTTAGMSRPVMFTTPAVLAAGTEYVLAVEPSTATSLSLRWATVRVAAAWDQTYGGQAWHYATAKNPATATNFTLTSTKRPLLGLIFDQVDDGASAGGGVIGGPNKRGGKQ